MRRNPSLLAACLAMSVVMCGCRARPGAAQVGMLEDQEHGLTAEDSAFGRATRPLPGPVERPPWSSARDTLPVGMLADMSKHAHGAAVEPGRPIPAPKEPRTR